MDNFSIVEEARRTSDLFSVIGQPQEGAPPIESPNPILEAPVHQESFGLVPDSSPRDVEEALDFNFNTPGRPEYESPRVRVRDPFTQRAVEMDTEASGAYYDFYQDYRNDPKLGDPSQETTLASHLAKPFDTKVQSNDVSCGQTSCAMVINHLTGKDMTDVDVNEKYGFRLLESLNGETDGYQWDDLGNVSTSTWGGIEERVNDGMPVILGLNGPEFSPSGRGHIVTVTGINGDIVQYADPADGKTKETTKEAILKAPQHPDGNFIFGARRLSGKQSPAVEPYQFRAKAPTTDITQLAAKHGFLPVDDSGLYGYAGAQSTDEGLPENFQSMQRTDGSWNDDKENAMSMAQIEGVNPDVFLNLIDAESSWKSDAQSPVGAFGQTQLMPETAMEQASLMGLNVTLDDIKQDPTLQKQIGLGYLKRQLQDFGNYPQALAAYNAGPGRVQSIIEGESSIPQETLNYVQKILGIDDEQLAASLIKDYKGVRAKSLQMQKDRPQDKPKREDWLSQQGAPSIEQLTGEQESPSPMLVPASEMKKKTATMENVYSTNEELAEVINGISYNVGQASEIVRNAGIQRKREVSDEVSGGLMNWLGFDMELGTFAASTAGQLTGFERAARNMVMDSAPSKWLLSFVEPGQDINYKIDDVVENVVQYMAGSVLSEKHLSDFNYGRDVGSSQVKNFANTLSLGLYGWGREDGRLQINGFHDLMAVAQGKKGLGNGEYLTKDEQKSTQQFRDAFKQQGGLIQNRNAGSVENFVLDLEAGFAENPLAPIAMAIQMEAAAALAVTKPLVAAAKGSGATGMLARGTQNFLKFIGSAGAVEGQATKAAVQGGKSTIGRALSSPFIKAEVAMGVLGGTEVFNTQFGKYISSGNMTAGEAFMQASMDGTFAAGLGFAFGLGSKFVGSMGNATLRGFKSIGTDLASRPAVNQSSVYRFTKNVGDKLGSLPVPAIAKQARGLLSKLDKQVRDTVEAHGGGMAEQYRITQHQDNYRAIAGNSHRRNKRIAEDMRSEQAEFTDVFEKAESEFQTAEQSHQQMEQQFEELRSAPNAPAEAMERLDYLQDQTQRKIARQRKVEEQIEKLESDAAQNPQAIPYLEQAKRELADIEKAQNNLVKEYQSIEKEDIVPYMEQVAMERGMDRVPKYSRLKRDLEKSRRELEQHPAREVLDQKELFDADNRLRKYAIDMAEQQAEKDLAVSEGRTPVPPPADYDYVWRDVDEALTASEIRSIVQQDAADVNTVMPWETKVKLDTMIREMGDGKMLDSNFVNDYSMNLDKFVKGITDKNEKKFYTKRVKEFKKQLETAAEQGQTMVAVADELISEGSFYETIKGMLRANPNAVEVLDNVDATNLSQLMAQDEGVARSLVAKMGLTQDSIKMDKFEMLLNEFRSEGIEATPDRRVKDIGLNAYSLAQTDENFRAMLKQRAPELDMSDSRSVEATVGDALKSLASDAEGLVRGNARYMTGATKAFKQLGSIVGSLGESRLAKGLDDISDRIRSENFSEVDNPELLNFIRRETNPEDGTTTIDFDRAAVEQYITDSLFEGGDNLVALAKEVPEIRDAVLPLLQVDQYFKAYDLMTPDMLSLANDSYLGTFLPRTVAYAKTQNNIFPKELLRKAGIVNDKGELVITPQELGQRADAAQTALGGLVEWNDFLNMSRAERSEVLRATGFDGGFGSDAVDRITADLLGGGRMSSPGDLLQARVESLGRAESARKFLDRMTMFSDENMNPLVWVKGFHKGERPAEHIPLSQVKGLQTQQYGLQGKNRKASDVFVSKDAADLLEKYHSEASSSNLEDKYVELVRLQNALALGGPHLPFLATIGSNMWQMMGYNMTRLNKSFNIRNQFTDKVEWSRLVQDAQSSGLELQTIENNALALATDFMSKNPKIMSDSAKSVMEEPGLAKAANRLYENFMNTARKNKGVKDGVVNTAIGTANGLRNFDEWIMEHLLFQNLKDAQIGAWMYKSNQIETQLRADGVSKGLNPSEIRTMARREAATLVNAFAGTVDSGSFSSGFKKALRMVSMTPQFFGARLRAIQGAVTENAFKDFPEASRKRLVSEYRWMLGKMALATGASGFLAQYMLTGTTPLDNGEGNMFSVALPNGKMISNPMGAYINTISKLTGTQEMARGIGNSLRAQMIESNPELRNVPGMDPSPLNMPTTAGTVAGQSFKQLHNLAAPGPKGIMGVKDLPDSIKYNEESILPAIGRKAMSDIGMVQYLTNRDSWTGAKKEDWEWYLNQSGAYVRKDNRIKDYPRKMQRAARESMTTLRDTVETTLREAHKAQDPQRKQALIEEAWRLADPYGLYPEEGGVKVGKALQKAFFNKDTLKSDGRMRLSPDQWDNLVSGVVNPDAYARGTTPTGMRPYVDEFRNQKQRGKDFIQGQQGRVGELSRGLEGL